MVGGPDVGVEEELTSVGVGPVFWDGELGFLVVFGVVDECF
jgi:hypothetical protein